MAESYDATPAAQAAERVLEDTWTDRERRHGDRERRVHALFAAAVIAAGVALLALAPDQGETPLGVAVALVAAYAWAARVEIAVGAGFAVPTQVALVPMLLVLPPALVPLLVAAGLVLATVAERGREQPLSVGRVLVTLGDAAYALPPAAVVVAFGAPDAGIAAVPVLVLAGVAQCAGDFAASALREALTRRVRPSLQLAVMLEVWSVDALLWPVGVVLASATLDEPLAVLALLPLLALLQRLVRDRNRRLEQAQERLVALRTERERLRQAVRRIGDAFVSGTEHDPVLHTTLQAIVEALGAGGARLMLTSAAGELAVVTEGEPVGAGPLVTVLTATELTAARLELPGAVGALAPADEDLCRHLLERAVLCVEHLRRQAEVFEQAQTDELTGLANRRRLRGALDAALEDLADGGRPVSLVLLDLDDFKLVNDRWGHQAGDLVLRTAAFCVRDNARRADLTARYGGEEFAMLLRVDAEGAAVAAERIAVALRDTRVPIGANVAVPVTASFGVATAGTHGEDAHALVAAADAALYRAKRAGKDRVELALAVASGEHQPA